ncbi:peptide chain release factor N(5)-glutamine methyltransferase [Candidatus Parcubacteria bacterium]|nr:MAG: peptide chain release factor N(5)-glutamine methyltransferase [Candidatus Parcubacteria bacterium]
MQIKQALIHYASILKRKKILSPDLDAEVLLAFVLKKPKEYLYIYPEKNLTARQLADLNIFIKRRAEGEPVAYIRGKKEFFGLDFYVDKRVLIPRPETEILVEEVINIAGDKLSAISNKSLTICDIGTGSGCIAISLAKHLPQAKILAVDVSKAALAVTRKNAKIHQVKIGFFMSNLLTNLLNKKIDIIVANLPYGWKKWKNNTSQETIGLKYEPKNSLFTKEGGLYLYRILFEQLEKIEERPKYLTIEIDPGQTMAAKNLLKKIFPYSKISLKKDLAGNDRVLIIGL